MYAREGGDRVFMLRAGSGLFPTCSAHCTLRKGYHRYISSTLASNHQNRPAFFIYPSFPYQIPLCCFFWKLWIFCEENSSIYLIALLIHLWINCSSPVKENICDYNFYDFDLQITKLESTFKEVSSQGRHRRWRRIERLREINLCRWDAIEFCLE